MGIFCNGCQKEYLSEGIPTSEILDDYPLLKEVHIKAALAFAARREEIVRVLTVDIEDL